jgi:hypothetical protein
MATEMTTGSAWIAGYLMGCGSVLFAYFFARCILPIIRAEEKRRA